MRVPSSVIFRRLVAAFFAVVWLAGSLGANTALAGFFISEPENGRFELARMFYNTRGLLERTEYADGTSERTLYDAEGRREYSYDRRGMGMQTVYDALGRVEATWFIGDGGWWGSGVIC